MIDRRLFVTQAGAVITASCCVSLAGCTESESTADDQLAVIHRSGEVKTGDAYIAGQAKNTSDRTMSDAEVTAFFYDDNEERIGSGVDSTNRLEPDNKWEFEIRYSGERSHLTSDVTLETSANFE